MKMLPCRARLRTRVLIILALCQVSASTKPIISPSEQQIVINEGEPLEISCTGSTPIEFVYPHKPGKLVNTSTPKTSNDEENGVYKYVFQRPKTVFGDTGWYGCADHNIDFYGDTNPNYDSEMNWLYVFVKSDTNLFVEANTGFPLYALAGRSVVIPCRTTSPDLVPILIKYKGGELEEASFDPRSGFTLRDLLVEDSNVYKCSIKKDSKEHADIYVLYVHLKRTLPLPWIQDDSRLLVTRGQDLYVNCTVGGDIIMFKWNEYVFDWKTPQQNSSRRNTQQFREQLYGNTVQVTCQLTILNVTDEDVGEYECVIRSVHDTKKITTNIAIYEPINLRPQHSDRYRQIKEGGYVEWVVYVDGYPKPHLQWFKNGWPIFFRSPKNFMNINATATILKIISLDVWDTGNYTLEATNINDYTIEKLNFTLDVITKPVPTLLLIDTYYSFNTSRNFHCKVIANLAPNITMSFTRYPNYPSLTDLTEVYLTSVMRTTYNSYEYKSTAKMSIEVSGKITCTACNTLNCSSVTKNILVSDGVYGFGIIGPKEPVLKGDNIELTCAASIYNYTDEFAWSMRVNQIKEPLIETDKLQIVHKTLFTYRSTLKLNNVQKSDAKDYFCTGKISDNTGEEEYGVLSKYADYKLNIHDPVPPFFTKTNVNETKIRTIDENAEGHKTVILQCFAKGMPMPTVTWYKDKVLLKKNDQYLFTDDYQELNIKYLKQHDSGNYSCRAISRLGTNETYQLITVKNAKWYKLDIILAASIAILGFILTVVAICFIIKIRRKKKMRKELMEAGLMHFEEGAIGQWCICSGNESGGSKNMQK